jgi:hypothetical protein
MSPMRVTSIWKPSSKSAERSPRIDDQRSGCEDDKLFRAAGLTVPEQAPLNASRPTLSSWSPSIPTTSPTACAKELHAHSSISALDSRKRNRYLPALQNAPIPKGWQLCPLPLLSRCRVLIFSSRHFARSASGNLLHATRSLDRRSAPELTQAARSSPIPAGIDATRNRPKLPIQDRMRACTSTLRQTSAPRSVPWTDRRDPAVRGAQAPASSEIELPWLTPTAFYPKMCSS